jgi:hypothetical protein
MKKFLLIKNIIYIYMNNNIKKEVIIRSIKILDIAYIFSVYAISGFFFSLLLDKIFPIYDEKKYKTYSKTKIIAEICLQFAAIGIIVYMIKNLFELVPFPFEGVYGYEHKKVKELDTALPLTYTILYFQKSLKDKLMYLSTLYFKTPIMGLQLG